MELEKKHYYLGVFILVLALIAFKMHLNEQRRLRALEDSAVIKAIPNAALTMKYLPTPKPVPTVPPATQPAGAQ